MVQDSRVTRVNLYTEGRMQYKKKYISGHDMEEHTAQPWGRDSRRSVILLCDVFVCKQRTQVSGQTALGFQTRWQNVSTPSSKRDRKLPDRCARIPKVAGFGLLVGCNLHFLHEVRYGIAKCRFFFTYSEINVSVS